MLHTFLWLFPDVLPNHVSVAAALDNQALWQMELCFFPLKWWHESCIVHNALLGSVECFFWVTALSDQACLFGIVCGFANPGLCLFPPSFFKPCVGLQCMVLLPILAGRSFCEMSSIKLEGTEEHGVTGRISAHRLLFSSVTWSTWIWCS